MKGFKTTLIEREKPEYWKWVPVIDEYGECFIYRLTPHGWNMREVQGVDTPNVNRKLIYWLKQRT